MNRMDIIDSNRISLVIPPEELINYTCGFTSSEEYKKSAVEVGQQFNLVINKYLDTTRDQGPVLDFGCGAGRLLGVLDFGKAIVKGVDVNEEVVTFAKKSYPHAEIIQSNLLPPLPFESGFFKIIYSFSVFSHLSESVENQWLTELNRVAKSGCLFLLSIQGDWFIEATLDPHEQSKVKEKGFEFKKVHFRDHAGIQFPSYYESSYHTSKFIFEKWAKYFDILEIIKGDNPENYLYGDHAFVNSGGIIPNTRPMGQCLVIARKK
jgi:SAM-dependent methyltransferase